MFISRTTRISLVLLATTAVAYSALGARGKGPSASPYPLQTGPDQGGPRGMGTKSKKAATPRWHGRIVRFNKDDMTLDVRKGTVEKRIHFDSSTQFVKPKTSKTTEPVDMSTLKEGDDVICIGTTDEKGDFHATIVQLQPGK